jgi:hypothetical protein
MSASRDRVEVWQERLRLFKQSGLTVAKFCQREGISVPSFYEWRRRLAETSVGPQAKQIVSKQRRETPVFQQVTLAGAGTVIIEWPSGVRMELPAQQIPWCRPWWASYCGKKSAA